jgi:hypothetical protein
MIDPRVQRAREEQIRLVELLKSGHPERQGIELAICDWFWEEMGIERERAQAREMHRVTLYDTSATRVREQTE